MTKLQSQTTSNPSSISQHAAVAALNGSQDFVRDALNSYREQRASLLDGIASCAHLKAIAPMGTFYVLVDCSSLVGKRLPDGTVIHDDNELVVYLLERGVAVVPGSAFGMSGYFRLSFATDGKTIEKAIDRIRRAIDAVQ